MKDAFGRGMESRPTVKDAHSPAGQEFYAPPSFADWPDCPRCKYGTPKPQGEGKPWLCVDCKATMAKEEVAQYNRNKR